MQIGTNAVFIEASFGLIFFVITGARDNFAKGLAFVFEGSQARMIFVAYNLTKLIVFNYDVAD